MGVERIPDSYFDLVSNQVDPALPRTSGDGAESWSLGTFGGSDDQTSDGPGDYGMNFWVNTNGLWPGVPANVYAAIGHGGQKNCVVMPDLELVATGIGTWGSPGDARSTQVMNLLIEADNMVAVQPSTWGAIKAAYRGE